MTQHDDSTRLRHMLDHSREAVTMASGKSRADLDTQRMLELALTRLVEIVGEAANRMSAPMQAQNPQIPWPQIIGLRNRLIHGYDAVDLNILWEIIQNDLPPLIESLEEIAGKEA